MESPVAVAVKALVLYTLAEAQAGHASLIEVSVNDHSFEVRDNGRGHALDKHINGTPYLRFIYEQLDFPFGQAEPGEVQLQGIGMSLINAACEQLQVTVTRAGEVLTLGFRDGRRVSEERAASAERGSGNRVRGVVRQTVAQARLDEAALLAWLHDVQRAAPHASISFNGRALVATRSGLA